MSARQNTQELMRAFAHRDISIGFDEANTLRRAQITLHRWAELECGDGNDYASWAIERDDTTGIPYMRRYPHDGQMRQHRIPDREAGALRRVAEICKRLELHYYHQGDPRGCALYVSNEPIGHNSAGNISYTTGIACCVD